MDLGDFALVLRDVWFFLRIFLRAAHFAQEKLEGIQVDVKKDMVLVSAKDRARAILPLYATSNWVNLAPYVIVSLENLVKALPFGKSLGEKLPEVVQPDLEVCALASSSVPLPGLSLIVGPVGGV